MKTIPRAVLFAALAMLVGSLAIGAKRFAAQGAENSLQDQIVAKEREGLDALGKDDKSAFADGTADDALFVDPRGTATKAEVVSHVAAFRLVDYTMEDVKFLRLSADSGMIAYKLTEKGNSHGRDFTAKVYASALWAKRNGKWLCVFSQETPVREALPH